MFLDRESNRAAARAEIQHGRWTPFQGQFHQQFSFRPGNQDRRVHGEVEAVELLVADDVGDRLAALSARSEIDEPLFRFFAKASLLKSENSSLRKPRGLGEQQAGLPSINAARAQGLLEGQAASSASAESCSAWCSAASASSSSSSSPSMMRSILYSVRLMRWSVTRPCGKLYVRMRCERSPEPISSFLVEAVFACCSLICLSRIRAAS